MNALPTEVARFARRPEPVPVVFNLSYESLTAEVEPKWDCIAARASRYAG